MRKRTVTAAVGPVFLVSSIFGLYPYRKNKLNLSLVIFSIVFLAGSSLIMYDWFSGTFMNNAFERNIYGISILLQYITAFIGLAMIVSKHNNFLEIIKLIALVDLKLEKLNSRFIYDQSCYIIVWFIKFTLLMLHLSYNATLQTAKGPVLHHSLVTLLLGLPSILLDLLTRQHNVILYFSGEHFSFINRKLKRHNKETIREKSGYVEKLLAIYNLLCEICDLINKYNSINLLAVSSSVFFVVTTSCFSLIRGICALIDNKDNISWKKVVRLFSSLICGVWLMFELISHSEKCRFQAKQFTNTLYNLMIEDETNELAHNEKLQLHMIMKREINFTACGFFPLDYTLIHSMVAASTTYLIILIQFGPYNYATNSK